MKRTLLIGAVLGAAALTALSIPAARAQSALLASRVTSLVASGTATITTLATNVINSRTAAPITIKSSNAATGAGATNVIIDSTAALSGTDEAFTVKVNGTSKFGIWPDGTPFPAVSGGANLGYASKMWLGFYAYSWKDTSSNNRWNLTDGSSGNSIMGAIANGASAIANKIGNVNALSTDGAAIMNLYSDNLTTLKVKIHASGGIQQTAATLATCAAANEGRFDTDAAGGGTSGHRTKVCLCTSNGAGTPVYAWVNLGSGTVGTTTTCAD
jgi:hypothetical protein